jgi:membrane-associated protease RseP (regulator of RpoE activity)
MDDTILGWFFFFFVVYAIVFCAVGFNLGKYKGRAAEGFWWGFFLGFVGVIIVALYPPKPGFQASTTPTSGPPIGSTPIGVDKRREAILEAIRRDPILAQDTSPQTLARLELEAGTIEKEMVLREEVEQALRQQQEEKEAEVQAKIDRDLFDAKVAETGKLLLGAGFGFPIAPGSDGFRPGNGCLRIVPGSPADRAGLQPGDLLMSMNDERIRTNDDVEWFMAGARVGDQVLLHIRRGSSKMVLEVDL